MQTNDQTKLDLGNKSAKLDHDDKVNLSGLGYKSTESVWQQQSVKFIWKKQSVSFTRQNYKK